MPHIQYTSIDGYNAKSGDCRTFVACRRVHPRGNRKRRALASHEHWYRGWRPHTALTDWPCGKLCQDGVYLLSSTTATTGADRYVPGAYRYPLEPCPFCTSRSLW